MNVSEEQLKINFERFDDIVEGLQGLSAMALMKKVGDVSEAIKLQRDFMAQILKEHRLITLKVDELVLESESLKERLDQCLKKHQSDI